MLSEGKQLRGQITRLQNRVQMHVHICIRVCTLSPGQMEQESALKLRYNSFISTAPYSTSQCLLEPPQQT